MNERLHWIAKSFITFALGFGCSSAGGSAEPACLRGASTACTCSDGRTGAQVCLDGTQLGACTCGEPVDGGGAATHEDGATSTIGTGTDAPMDVIATFCGATFGARADLLHNCCSVQDQGDRKWAYELARVSNGGLACHGDLSASLAKGRISINNAAMTSCLADAKNGPAICSRPDVLAPLPTSCSAAFLGLQDSSAPCLHHYECKPGLACNSNTATSDGLCTVPAREFKPCLGPADGGAPSFELPLGLDHSTCSPGATCHQGTCINGKQGGDPCSLGGNPGRCGPGMACVESTGVYDTCVPTDGSEGSACDGYFTFCGEGLGCSNFKCVPLKTNGQPCDLNGDDCLGHCDGFQTNVSHAGTCVAMCGSAD
jgi:hypothetical protein